MNWLIFVLWAVVTTLFVFAAYWSGRSTGERSVYLQQREKHDRLREENIELKLLNERLRGLTGYPGGMSNMVADKSSPGDSASADPESASM